MEYVYPAVFGANQDGSYTITFPDLPGCISEGKSLANAMYMAQSALNGWVEYMESQKETLPRASELSGVNVSTGQFVNLIRAETKDGRAVKRTVSLPYWLDSQAAAAGLSLSRVLQDALAQRFQ